MPFVTNSYPIYSAKSTRNERMDILIINARFTVVPVWSLQGMKSFLKSRLILPKSQTGEESDMASIVADVTFGGRPQLSPKNIKECIGEG